MSSADRFVDEMGVIFQESGGTRIAGRIVGLLMVEGKELSLSQLSERLGVSRASISTNARDLSRRGAVKLTTHSGDRQDYYTLSSVPFFDMLGDIATKMARHGRIIATHIAAVRSENAGAADRIAEMQSIFEKSSVLLHDWAAALRNDAAPQRDDK